jgi:HEAT repeat protein/3',5'-cyclic AMP phosphodiesterase CpdA
MVDWSRYLASLCNTYAQWWQVYTLTDVVGRQRVESEPSPLLLDFGLMVQTVEREKGEKEKIERLTVLDGLRKYASEHVLLVGRPGSGKSTALVRLVLEEAEKNLTPQPPSLRGKGEQVSPLLAGEGQGERSTKVQGNQPKIPVLVELRYYRTSILDLIQDFLQRHEPNLTVDVETLKGWLRQGQLLLLVDGVNELPSEEARRELQKFRQDYHKTTPMIFTTRDLGVGGDLDIAKKLEMQPLSEAQMQQFVRAYLPEQGNEMLKQLRSRLREFGQTPLLLWMLCSLFRAMGKVPPNLGLVFRQFAQSYYGKLKQDVPVTEESRDWCQLLLEQLAFRMTQGREKTQLQVAISKQEAEEILTAFLRDEGLEQPRNRALKWLKDLLKHHLIQLGADNQIEFRHQLIQEYYTAEYLLKVLTPPRRTSPPAPLLRGEESKIPVPPFPDREGGLGGLGISDDELKREYLNYLKWTEPLALMLELVEDEAQAVRVVKLALEVDLRLGARLAGAVKPEFQTQTVSLVSGLAIPQLLKIQLLEITKSEKAIPELVKALNDEDSDVRRRAAEALGKIGSDAAIEELVKALNDEDSDVRRRAAEALGKIGSDAAIEELVKALNHENSSVRRSVANALLNIGSDAAIEALVKALNHEDFYVRKRVTDALGNIGSDAAIPGLVKALNDENSSVRSRAAKALSNIGSDAAIPGLVKALNQEDYDVRMIAANALGKIGSDAAIEELVKALNQEDYFVRMIAVVVLGEIGSDVAINELVKALNQEDYFVRMSAAEALGKIGSDAAIEELFKALNQEDYFVRMSAAEALGKIGSDAAIEELVKALNQEDSSVRKRAAEALGKIGSDAAIEELVKALNQEDSSVRRRAAEALGKIGSDAAIEELVKALNQEDSSVRMSAAEALGKIASDAAIPELIKVLNDEDSDVRMSAAEALGKIASDAAIPELVKALNDEDSDVRMSAAEALGKIGSDAAIEELVKALDHEDSSVRWWAAGALGKIGSDAAIPELVKTLNDENSSVRSRAAEALGKIASSELLPIFSERLKTDKETKLLNTISAIQERCKFYNYTLTQPSSASGIQCSEISPTPHFKGGNVQSISITPMHILHLSDLHFGTLDQANLWSNQLAEDLHQELNIRHLDALILSGDITNYSTETEYSAAKEFINELAREFQIRRSHIIIVPGNHDLNRELGDKAFSYDENGLPKRDLTQHQRRFDYFRTFYQAIKGEAYPLEYEHQGIVYHLPKQKLLILGLNSAWKLDRFQKTDANINDQALTNALKKIRDNEDLYEGCVKIAVWHHPLNSSGEDRIKDQGFMERLAQNGFRLALHGHIHTAKKDLFNYDYTSNTTGRKLDIICAGTFGAPTKELVTGYPWQYNLLKIEDNQLTVYTRRREELNGAWKPDARWLQGAGKTPLDYYAISLLP